MKLPSVYNPSEHEAKIYAEWEKSRVFTANPQASKPRFSISMPPPNETGTLHVGHALFLTLQDVMARHARQTGHDVLWLPGTDHAALATNAIIEKRLAEQGTDKHKIGREQFISEVKAFVADSRNTINAQIKAMGASCDWSRARYTLDDALNRCVNEVFKKMYDDGLIYRGHRIVNWDPRLETTVSDDEVVHQEEKTPLYTLKFGPFQISTARPETKFGDKYVVMHPDDERYKQYKDGDSFECEWLNGKITATVVKDEAVDPAFGTGVMTITPWHDHTDFEIAERHGLEKEQIIGFDGKLLPVAGPFSGMAIEEARPKIIELLKDKGLLVETDENYVHNIALNDRGKGVIEPHIKLQWFVRVDQPTVMWKGQLRSFKEVMRAVVEDGDINVVPQRFVKVYYHWIDNLRDWCISRQIWWGHRIPVWYKDEEIYVGVQPPDGQGWTQDPDTLDTWFSSALWTWSTLVDPKLAGNFSLSLKELLDKSEDYKTYHPTSVMETGWDILFFWVARMILATTYVTGEVPFKNLYLHGLVRTEQGKKMSKSDPEGMIDPLQIIPEYGADALRLALLSGVGAGNDQRLGLNQIVAGRNFCNKLWNIARFVQDKSGEDKPTEVKPQSPADFWILDRLDRAGRVTNGYLKKYRFNEAYETVYHFVWDELADWYIEAAKTQLNKGVLAYVLDNTLKLVHPFAPFVTEAIWDNLGGHKDMLIAQPWPAVGKVYPIHGDESVKFANLIEVASVIRHVCAVLEAKKPALYLEKSPELVEQSELLVKLAGLSGVKEGAYEKGLRLPLAGTSAWLDIDKAKAAAYIKRLEEQKAELTGVIKLLNERLANKNYIDRAPAALVEQTKNQLTEQKSLLAKIEEEIEAFKKASR